MKSLEERGLILKIKGDQYTPNKLGLVYSADHLKAKKIVANQEEKQKVSEGEKSTSPEDQKSTHFKDSSSNDNFKYSLSKTPILENYFSQIRAPKKVEREREALFSLVDRNPDVTLAEWIESFSIVMNDSDGSGKKIQSPLVWLARGFDKYLPRARAQIERTRRDERINAEYLSSLETPQQPAQGKSETLDGLSNEEVSAQFNAAWGANQLSFVTDRHLRDISEQIAALEYQCGSMEAGKNAEIRMGLGAKISELRSRREAYIAANSDLLSISLEELDNYLWQVEESKSQETKAKSA